LNEIVAISSGNNYSVALDSSGNVWEWGYNNQGQLGDGSTTESEYAVEVSDANVAGQVSEVYAGGSMTTNGQVIALLDDGSVYAWGSDTCGQLGNEEGNCETQTYSTTPISVDVPSGVTFNYVASGGTSSFALDSNGNVWAWGDDSEGQLGDGSDTGYVLDPEEVASGWTYLSAVATHVVGG
jgi:alpha-tubulin suppressor-like RCC1 family protein